MTRIGIAALCVSLFAVPTLAGCLVSFEDYPVGELSGGGGMKPDGSAGSSGFGAGWGVGGAGTAGAGAAGGVSGVGGVSGTGGLAGSAGTCSSGLSCVAIPAGWTPAVIGAGGAACAGDWNQDVALGHTGLIALNECDCPCEIGCNVSLIPYSMSSCSGTSGTPLSFDAGTGCQSVTFTAGSVSVTPVAVCAPAGPAQPKAVSWASDVRVCSVTSVDCAGGKCLPPATELCIYKDGDESCPQPFGPKQLLYTAVSDTRQCGACTCDATQPSCSLLALNFYEATNCSPVPFSCPTACCDVSPNKPMNSAAAAFQTGGTCSILDNGYVSGEATATSPITVCCTS